MAVEKRERGRQIHVCQRQSSTAARPLHEWQEATHPPLFRPGAACMHPRGSKLYFYICFELFSLAFGIMLRPETIRHPPTEQAAHPANRFLAIIKHAKAQEQEVLPWIRQFGIFCRCPTAIHCLSACNNQIPCESTSTTNLSFGAEPSPHTRFFNMIGKAS